MLVKNSVKPQMPTKSASAPKKSVGLSGTSQKATGINTPFRTSVLARSNKPMRGGNRFTRFHS